MVLYKATYNRGKGYNAYALPRPNKLCIVSTRHYALSSWKRQGQLHFRSIVYGCIHHNGYSFHGTSIDDPKQNVHQPSLSVHNVFHSSDGQAVQEDLLVYLWDSSHLAEQGIANTGPQISTPRTSGLRGQKTSREPQKIMAGAAGGDVEQKEGERFTGFMGRWHVLRFNRSSCVSVLFYWEPYYSTELYMSVWSSY